MSPTGLRRAWSWLWRPLRSTPRANGECPTCGRAVVLFPTRWMGTSHSGPMMAPRTEQEAVAACPEHGRPPFNDASRMLAAGPD